MQQRRHTSRGGHSEDSPQKRTGVTVDATVVIPWSSTSPEQRDLLPPMKGLTSPAAPPFDHIQPPSDQAIINGLSNVSSPRGVLIQTSTPLFPSIYNNSCPPTSQQQQQPSKVMLGGTMPPGYQNLSASCSIVKSSPPTPQPHLQVSISQSLPSLNHILSPQPPPLPSPRGGRGYHNFNPNASSANEYVMNDLNATITSSTAARLSHSEWMKSRVDRAKQRSMELEQVSTPFLQHLRRIKVRATALHTLLQEETDRTESIRLRRLGKILAGVSVSADVSVTTDDIPMEIHKPLRSYQGVVMEAAVAPHFGGHHAPPATQIAPLISPRQAGAAAEDHAIHNNSRRNNKAAVQHHPNTVSPHPPAQHPQTTHGQSGRHISPVAQRSTSPSGAGRRVRVAIDLPEDAPVWLRKLHEVLQ